MHRPAEHLGISLAGRSGSTTREPSKFEKVQALASATALKVRRRISAGDMLFNSDPIGELVIATPLDVIDDYATVIAIDFNAR
jgi:hypothetical protein